MFWEQGPTSTLKVLNFVDVVHLFTVCVAFVFFIFIFFYFNWELQY